MKCLLNCGVKNRGVLLNINKNDSEKFVYIREHICIYLEFKNYIIYVSLIAAGSIFFSSSSSFTCVKKI